MESFFTQSIGGALDQEDTDPLAVPDDRLEEINIQTQNAVEAIKGAIIKFKRDFYRDYVGNDKGHNPNDLGAMMGFHALFLQALGFWIGLLDSKPVPKPTLESGRDRRIFDLITKSIQQVAASPDGRTLVYSLLFHFAQQHPFDLGQQQNVEDE
jgi:hypothetical protein